MPEQVHGLSRLPTGAGLHPARVAPPQWHVLPQEEAGLVGGVVQRRPRHVGLEAQDVEAGVDGQPDVAAEVVVGGLGQVHGRWPLDRALEEQALPVDRPDPAADVDAPQARVDLDVVARGPALRPEVGGRRHPPRAVGPRTTTAGVAAHEHGDRDGVARLVAERPRPPEGRVGDGHVPLEVVLAGGQVRLLAVLHAEARIVEGHHPGDHLDRPRVRAVERRSDGHNRRRLVGLAAQDAAAGDPHRTGPVQPHRSPEATRVVGLVALEAVAERPGEVALARAVRLGRARHLHGEHVGATSGDRLGDLERVGGEVALGVAQVRPVEPHVGAHERALQDDPPTVARSSFVATDLEPVPVEERPVLVREGGRRAPVAGHRHRLPRGVVAVDVERHPPGVVVGDGRPPLRSQLPWPPGHGGDAIGRPRRRSPGSPTTMRGHPRGG